MPPTLALPTGALQLHAGSAVGDDDDDDGTVPACCASAIASSTYRSVHTAATATTTIDTAHSSRSRSDTDSACGDDADPDADEGVDDNEFWVAAELSLPLAGLRRFALSIPVDRDETEKSDGHTDFNHFALCSNAHNTNTDFI